MKRTAIILLCLLFLCGSALPAGAAGATVIVSLGDSYSSGEGVEPFYGQDAEMADKCQDPDWIAHRSEINWPGMLTLPAVDGPMKDHRGTNWFFVAASGAKAEHLFLLTEEEAASGRTAQQEKTYRRDGVSGQYMLPGQLDIFDELDAKGLKADYVTLTIGGNDIGFPQIVAWTIAGMTEQLPGDTAEEKAASLWEMQYVSRNVRADIKRAYMDVAARAGEQACIIVVGYPHPVSPDHEAMTGSSVSSQIMNAACDLLNEELRDIAEECRREGINICFVSVEEAFAGHGAYTDDPYVNPIINGAMPQDLKDAMMVSNYSMHPNEEGVEAYASCVQEMLDALEAE